MVQRVTLRTDTDPRIHARDPEEFLSSAAVDAALELDRLTVGSAIDRRPVRDLVRRLQSPFVSGSGDPVPLAYIDSSFVVVLDDAIRASPFRGHVETVEELKALSERIRATLESIAAADEGAQFEVHAVGELRDFCLALARRSRSIESRDLGDDE